MSYVILRPLPTVRSSEGVFPCGHACPTKDRSLMQHGGTVIRQILYDLTARQLIIVFQSGRRYAYSHVTADVHAELQAAPSRGAYFNEWIRDRFPCQCVDVDFVLMVQIH